MTSAFNIPTANLAPTPIGVATFARSVDTAAMRMGATSFAVRYAGDRNPDVLALRGAG